MHTNNGFEHRETPDELRPVETALEAVAEADRESAPTRLDQGVFLASWRNVRTLRNLGGDESDPVIARIHPGLAAKRRIGAVAAAVALVAAIWGATMLVRSGGTALASGLEDDVNFVLDLRSSSDDLATLGERIDTLFLDTTSVGDSLKNDATTILLGDGAL